MRVDDLQHLGEEMLICLMSRGNLCEAAWFISNIWKALLISSALVIIRWFSHQGKGCECECLPGWFCSCWQSNGSVHCCMWTVCDVWDSFEILCLKWGTPVSVNGENMDSKANVLQENEQKLLVFAVMIAVKWSWSWSFVSYFSVDMKPMSCAINVSNV